jgi:hypothetical protein
LAYESEARRTLTEYYTDDDSESGSEYWGGKASTTCKTIFSEVILVASATHDTAQIGHPQSDLHAPPPM